jgi:hypothetical protein
MAQDNGSGLLMLAVAGAAAYFGWQWWQGQQTAGPAVAAAPAVTPPVAVPVPAVATPTPAICPTGQIYNGFACVPGTVDPKITPMACPPNADCAIPVFLSN